MREFRTAVLRFLLFVKFPSLFPIQVALTTAFLKIPLALLSVPSLLCYSIGSPVGGPHSLGEIRGAAAVGKASAAARNFLRVPSAPRVPMAMALTQAPRTGALVPMGVGVARLFLKKF